MFAIGKQICIINRKTQLLYQI